jgi:hypothetical protein
MLVHVYSWARLAAARCKSSQHVSILPRGHQPPPPESQGGTLMHLLQLNEIFRNRVLVPYVRMHCRVTPRVVSHQL